MQCDQSENVTCCMKYPCIGVASSFVFVLVVCAYYFAMLETTITNKPFSAVLIAIYERSINRNTKQTEKYICLMFSMKIEFVNSQ